MEKLLTILRGISAGHKTIFVDKDGNYISKQIDCFQTRGWLKDCEEKDIEGRLQFELYGEYPLSPSNKSDYDLNIRKAFILPVVENNLVLVKKHSL